LARRVGLERTSINTDQGKGTPFAYTEDVDSSPLADETSKNSEDRSPSHGEVTRLSDEERQSKDTDWIKKLEELYSRTETYRRGDTRAIMFRPSERCAGKQQQTCPTTLEHSYFSNETEEPDSTVDNDVLESPYQETRHSLQRRFGGRRLSPYTAPWIAQRIHEDRTPAAVGILLTWVHPQRMPEASDTTIEQLNCLSDQDVVLALTELTEPRKYIQGTGGNKLSIRTILTTKNRKNILETFALIDSGSTGSCIHRRFVEENRIPTKKLPHPIPVYNADGTLNKNGDITETVTLEMIIQDHKEEITLAVSNLGKADLFLGHEWLKLHNPTIDWSKSRIELDKCPSHCHYVTYATEVEEEPENWNTSDEEDGPPLEEGDRIFVFDVDSYLELNRTNYDYVKKYDPTYGKTKPWNSVVPPQYHDYEDVFTKKDFDKLPERRPWDHAIELTPGSKPTDCKTYPLSPQEQKSLQEFIDENLKTGRIRPSKSPMASPFFFVKKKDGSLRPTQDYRKLNEITIKNRYPLPLISELVDKLAGARVFTKMDVRWGYNNIRIKEGDEWKAAFRTNLGLFEPTVMFFGLTNSPATFQSFMNHIFRDLIAQGHVAVYMDDILIFTETDKQHAQVV